MLQAIQNGSGGDIAENDIEALIAAQQQCPDCENLVLIADNNAPVKDISLLSKVNKPVKVILCGSQYYLNPDYLKIARETGGSVHTMEADITRLAFLKEGEIFEFNGIRYRISKGSFVNISIPKSNS